MVWCFVVVFIFHFVAKAIQGGFFSLFVVFFVVVVDYFVAFLSFSFSARFTNEPMGK